MVDDDLGPGSEHRVGATPRSFFGEAIESFCDDGLLVEDAAGNLRMSERGLLLADSIATAFV